MKFNSVFLLMLLGVCLSACLPMSYPPGEKITVAQFADHEFITEDGAKLPLRQWLPAGETKAVLVALHGFNDYSRFFEAPGRFFSDQGIASFAYDQRGFGAAPLRGYWAGEETYASDLISFTRLLKQRYPRTPVYWLGESMGGAIVITALSRSDMPEVSGSILSAPALWARSTMPWYQTGLLWTLAHSVPWMSLTGKGVHVQASDNIEMLKSLGRDPLVIKETRIDAIYGLTDLMDLAYESATSLHGDLLVLYGENDQIIPKQPTYDFLQQLLATDSVDKTIAIYPEGYHMLLRDLKAPATWQDIVSWISLRPETLPSGADQRARQLFGAGDWRD